NVHNIKTRGMSRPDIYALFRKLDNILHGGDVGKWGVLADLVALAPVTAVYGNADGPDVRAKHPDVARLQLEGFDIVVTHGDQLGRPTPAKLHEAFPRAEIIVYGHTHLPLLELLDRTVTV